MRREVCEAPRSEGPRRDLLRLRDACLERRRGQLGTLTALLADKPDTKVLDSAVQAAAGLPPLAYCADAEALTARVRPPEDPALRARVAALEPRIDQLEALHAAGKYQDGLALADPILTEASALTHAPLRARAQFWAGRLRERNGDYDAAKALLRDAAVSASEGRDDLLAASAAAWMLYVVGSDQQRFKEANAVRGLGAALVARVQNELPHADWLNAEATLLDRASPRYAEAKAADQRAIAIQERALGPDHPELARSLNNYAIVLEETGDYPEALATHRRAEAIWQKALGPGHLLIAVSLGNQGNVLQDLGDFPGALAAQQRALALREAALGPDHPDVATSLMNLGGLLHQMGDYPRALPYSERSVAVHRLVYGPDSPHLAGALCNLGDLLLDMGDLPRGPRRSWTLPARSSRSSRTTPTSCARSGCWARCAWPRAGSTRRRRSSSGSSRGSEKCPWPVPPRPGRSAARPRRGLPGAAKASSGALPLLERALTLKNVATKPRVELTLAEALWRMGKDRPRAPRPRRPRPRASYEHLGHRPGLRAQADRWLEGHAL